MRSAPINLAFPMRESRKFTATLAVVFAVTERAEAGPRGVELGLRDSTEVFGVPSGSLGPSKSEKVNVPPLDVHKILRLSVRDARAPA